MIRLIDIYKDRFGVEPICVTLAGTEGGFISARGLSRFENTPQLGQERP